MRIMILGGSGQLGSSLRSMLGEVAAPSRAVVDLSDLDGLRSAVRAVAPELVINCAAYNAVDAAEADPDAAMRINRDAVALLGEEAPSLITFSTDYVFDGTLQRAYREDDAPNPLSHYGHSKRAGEQALLAIGAKALIIRTAWVWTTTHTCFVSTMMKLATERQHLEVVEDQVGCATYAPDLAAAVVAIIGRPDFRDARGIYHLAGAEPLSRYELALAAIERTAAATVKTVKPVPSAAFPAAAQRPARVVLDCSRAFADFGVRVPGYRDAFARALPTSIASPTS